MKLRFSILTLCLPMLLAMAVGCAGSGSKKRPSECKLLFRQIKQDWERDAITGLFRFKPGSEASSSTVITQNRDCLAGLSVKAIRKLFGEPSLVPQNDRLIYYLSEPCLRKEGFGADNCRFLSFQFGPDDHLKRVDVMINGVTDGYVAPKSAPEK